MNSAAEIPLYRSEAFAEDVFDLVGAAPASESNDVPPRWIVHAVPVAVALIGVAFAVVPPLG
jgi:hypothetical protein